MLFRVLSGARWLLFSFFEGVTVSLFPYWEANAPYQQEEHNFEMEKRNVNLDATLEDKIKEINNFQKHLNQTIKPYLYVENFPVS